MKSGFAHLLLRWCWRWRWCDFALLAGLLLGLGAAGLPNDRPAFTPTSTLWCIVLAAAPLVVIPLVLHPRSTFQYVLEVGGPCPGFRWLLSCACISVGFAVIVAEIAQALPQLPSWCAIAVGGSVVLAAAVTGAANRDLLRQA